MTDRSILKKKKKKKTVDKRRMDGQKTGEETGKQHRKSTNNIASPLLFLSSSPSSSSSSSSHRCSHVLPLPPNPLHLCKKRWRAAGYHGTVFRRHEKKRGEPSLPLEEREEGAFITMTKAAPVVNVVDFAVHTTSWSPSITSPLASFVLAAIMDVNVNTEWHVFSKAQWLNSREEDILNRSSNIHTYSVQYTLWLTLLFYPFTS